MPVSVRLRLKNDPSVADPTWWTIQRHPNSWFATVGGVTADGDYSVIVLDANGNPAVTTTFPREDGEDDAAIAAGLQSTMAGNIEREEGLERFLSLVTDEGGGVLLATSRSLRLVQDPLDPYSLATSAPPGASITLSPAGPFPITAVVPFKKTGAVFSFRALDGQGDVLQFTNTRANITVVTAGRSSVVAGDVDAIGRKTTISSHELASTLPETDLSSGREVTMLFGALTNMPVGMVALEAWVDFLP